MQGWWSSRHVHCKSVEMPRTKPDESFGVDKFLQGEKKVIGGLVCINPIGLYNCSKMIKNVIIDLKCLIKSRKI